METEKKKVPFEKTKEALGLIGLNSEEIDTFFKITGRGTVTKGEISILQDIPFEEADKIVNNLLSKGLLREIPGKTPHFVALPPYSALLSQISQFKSLISNIQTNTPRDLEDRFKNFENQLIKVKKLEEYQSYLAKIRDEVPLNINNQLNSLKSSLEKVTKLEEFHEIMDTLKDQVDNQLNSLQSGFSKVKELQEFNEFMIKLKSQLSTDLNNESTQFKDRLESIKIKISSVLEKQFRISALKTFAEKIVGQIISEEFGNIQVFFKEKFINKVQDTLNQILERILSVSKTASEISSTVEGAFKEITKNFEDTLEKGIFSVSEIAGGISSTVKLSFDEIVKNLENNLKETESRLSEVRINIVNTFEELRKGFKEEVFNTIQSDILRKIFEKLELSEKTMQEFWDRAKQASLLSFQDVWFIMSEEAMKAQINDSISRAKMRIHIISPKLQDIDIISLKNVPKHVNIRVSTLVNPSKDKGVLDEIAALGNTVIRNYPRQNIWAVNRDFEEVVVCVISRTESNSYEIAGMGSILEEHVKMFASILEGVWMESEKIMHKIDTEKIDASKIEPSVIKPIKLSENILTEPRIEEYETETPTLELTFKPISGPSVQLTQKPEQLPEVESNKITLISSEDASEFITKNFDIIKSMIQTEKGIRISEKLEELREKILEKIGFSIILHQISKWVGNLKKIKTKLPDSVKQELSDEIVNWVNKLIAKK